MATLHLICGLPCAGKTTLARQLERELPALRLTPDEWHLRFFGQDLQDFALHNTRHDLVEAMLWGVAARVLVLGVPVILDFGFWARSEREDYRERAAALGADSEIHFLDVPENVLIERLRFRNAQLPPDTFPITEENLREWSLLFEPHTQNDKRKP